MTNVTLLDIGYVFMDIGYVFMDIGYVFWISVTFPLDIGYVSFGYRLHPAQDEFSDNNDKQYWSAAANYSFNYFFN